MVTQAPGRAASLTALAFTLSCIGLIIVVWIQFGGAIPLAARGYRVHALFTESGLLVPGADVRISGVDIGKVSAVQARGIESLVTIEVQSPYAPIPADTRAILRQKTLLGEAYVELSPGDARRSKLPDGGTIPRAEVQRTQALDQVLASFDRPTQRDLQALLTGTGQALAGRGQMLNDAIGNFEPAVGELGAVVGLLDQQRIDLRALIGQGASVLTTLGNHSADLRSLVTAGDQVLSATAQRDGSLSATVDAMPAFLGQLRTTLARLNGTLALARPSLDALRPAAPLLAPALKETMILTGPATALLHASLPVLASAQRALPAIARLAGAFRPAVDRILAAAVQLSREIPFLAGYRREVLAAMANLAASTQARALANTPSGTAGYVRGIAAIGRESLFGQSVRDPTNRNNTYYAPGELADVGHGGLRSANCANASNRSQVPLPNANVSCRLQRAHRWGEGLLGGYFPHLRASPR
ncbi:MAG: MlaD family protein [Solirubrobacteraceae bacterium]